LVTIPVKNYPGEKKNKLLIVAWHIALMSKKRILDPTGKVKTI